MKQTEVNEPAPASNQPTIEQTGENNQLQQSILMLTGTTFTGRIVTKIKQ